MDIALGIDLGTTYSVAAWVGPDGQPTVILNAEGERTTPSVVWFGTDPPTVGLPAKDEQRSGATDVAAFFKRAMGDPNYIVDGKGRDYTPIDLSALVLGKLKADCEARLGRPVGKAVITVPAYFDNARREATIKAGRLAGLEVLRIINEPTAAALVYGLQRSGQEETCLIYDLGGGTFDVTVIRIEPSDIVVLGTDGDHELGGKDWDDCVARYLAGQFQAEHGIDPLDEPLHYQDLLVRCEQTKQMLSSRASVSVALDYRGIRGSYEISREKLEELTVDLMETTQRLTEQVLADAGLTWADLTEVVLVGGSTRMPMVRRYVERMSGRPPRTSVNPDEAVALGAAIQAARDLETSSEASVHGLTTSRSAAASENEAAPTRRLPPGTRRIRDVMSHSLGVVTEAEDRSKYVNTRIIPKNGPIPVSKTRPVQLRTKSRGENELEVYVTQGESDDPTHCAMLGRYRFRDIQHVAGAGWAVIDIRYDYDDNGMVTVSATQRDTGSDLPMIVEALPEDMSWISRPPQETVAAAPVTAYLAFDLSGSMSDEPLKEAQRAAREFVAQTDLSHNSLGIVSFADRVQTTLEACRDARRLEQAIASMSIGSVGYGNEVDPFEHARQSLKGVDGPRYIIVLTDGVWSDQRRATRDAAMCRQEGMEIIAIGFGGADRSFLKEISSAEIGSFYTDLSRLVETFGAIAKAMTEGSLKGLASQGGGA